MTIYDFTVMAQDGSPFSLEAYRGQVLLIVNTATGCGLTPQYQGLQELYERYHDQGLKSLTFHAINLWAKRRVVRRRLINFVASITKPASHALQK